MSYYVIGGRYSDTTFTSLVEPDAPLGPFESYTEAVKVWHARAMATIDQATTRFTIEWRTTAEPSDGVRHPGAA